MSSLQAACATAMQTEGVLGVMCVDPQGLCLHSEGKVSDSSSGAVAAMANQSRALLGGDAVVTVESSQGKILLTNAMPTASYSVAVDGVEIPEKLAEKLSKEQSDKRDILMIMQLLRRMDARLDAIENEGRRDASSFTAVKLPAPGEVGPAMGPPRAASPSLKA